MVPLYQERDGVAALRAELGAFLGAERARRSVELVLVDDGSTDGTADRLRDEFADLDAIHVVRHETNRGLTAALATGSDHATGDFVAWLDADLSYDPTVVSELCRRLDEGADVAIASCYHPDGSVGGGPRWRLWLSTLCSRIYRVVTGAGLYTYTCMVRAARREVEGACRPARGGFIGVTESLLRALRQRRRIVEVPTTLRPRVAGQSKMRVVRVGIGHFGLMAAWLTHRI